MLEHRGRVEVQRLEHTENMTPGKTCTNQHKTKQRSNKALFWGMRLAKDRREMLLWKEQVKCKLGLTNPTEVQGRSFPDAKGSDEGRAANLATTQDCSTIQGA